MSANTLAIIFSTALAITTLFVCWWLIIRARQKTLKRMHQQYSDELLRSKWVCSGECLDMVDNYTRTVDNVIFDIAEEIAIARGSKYKDTGVTYIQACDIEQAILKMELGVVKYLGDIDKLIHNIEQMGNYAWSDEGQSISPFKRRYYKGKRDAINEVLQVVKESLKCVPSSQAPAIT